MLFAFFLTSTKLTIILSVLEETCFYKSHSPVIQVCPMSWNSFINTIFVFFLVLFLTSLASYASDDFLTPVTSSHEKIKQLLKHSPANTRTISICYNYSCQTQRDISISEDDIRAINDLFKQLNGTQYGERTAIAHSIALLEKVAATQTPVYNDKARNINDNGLPGRMDCIDATVNTTHYLKFIDHLGLINKHKLQSPIYRSPYIMGQHWAAQIKDTDGHHYAVDSWQSDNGQLPIIQKVKDWQTREAVKSY